MVRGIYGKRIALSPKAEHTPLGWVSGNSLLCAFRLNGPIKVKANRYGERCLFVISDYALLALHPVMMGIHFTARYLG